MSDEEIVQPPHENAGTELAQDMIQDQQIAENQEQIHEEPQKEEHVPLPKYIKERKRRQELEQRVLHLESQKQPADDSSQYESATRADLGHTQNEVIRIVEERQWIRSNPEKYEHLQAHLEDFLEKKPYLADALRNAPNRWEEAYELMSALSNKERKVVKQQEKRREAPNAPTSVPKSSGIKETEDIMRMSDKEYNEWRASKRVRR